MVSKWWKCDLQVTTPTWNFIMPAGESYDLSTDAGCRAFAQRYVSELASRHSSSVSANTYTIPGGPKLVNASEDIVIAQHLEAGRHIANYLWTAYEMALQCRLSSTVR